MALDIDRFRHRCTDRDCPSFGQVTSTCGCHKPRLQVMLDLVAQLEDIVDPAAFAVAEAAALENRA